MTLGVITTSAAPASKPEVSQALSTLGSTAIPSSRGHSGSVIAGNDPSINDPSKQRHSGHDSTASDTDTDGLTANEPPANDPSKNDPDPDGSFKAGDPSADGPPAISPSDGRSQEILRSGLTLTLMLDDTLPASAAPSAGPYSSAFPVDESAGVFSAEADPNKNARQHGSSIDSYFPDSNVPSSMTLSTDPPENSVSRSQHAPGASFGNGNPDVTELASIIGVGGESDPSGHQLPGNAPGRDASVHGAKMHGDQSTAADTETSGQGDIGRDNEPTVSSAFSILSGEVVTRDPASHDPVIAGEQRVTEGRATDISGILISLGPKGVLTSHGSTLAQAELTRDGGLAMTSILTGERNIHTGPSNPRYSILGNPTIESVATPVTNGALVSLESDDLVYATNTATAFSPEDYLSGEPAPRAAVLTLGSQQITVFDSSGTAIIASQTLSLGGAPIKISGSTFSLGPSGIIAGSAGSSAIHSFSLIVPDRTQGIGRQDNGLIEASFTIDGHLYTAYDPVGHGKVAVIVGDNGAHPLVTLTDSASATFVDGHMISLGSEGMRIGNGRTTEDALWSKATTRSLPSDVSLATKASEATESVLGPPNTSSSAVFQTANVSEANKNRKAGWPSHNTAIWAICIVSWWMTY